MSRNIMKHVIENGKNEKGPHIFCNVGKAMPTVKLQHHEDKLPRDIATGLGAT